MKTALKTAKKKTNKTNKYKELIEIAYISLNKFSNYLY